MKMAKVYHWITVGILAFFIIGCSSKEITENTGTVSKDSTNAAEQNAITKEDNTDKELANNSEQNASTDIEYSPASPENIENTQGEAAFIAWVRYVNIPLWVRKEFFNQGLNKQYSYSFRDIRPLYLRGDFNSDRKTDIAVMLKNKTSKGNPNSAMAIFHGGNQQVIVIDDPDKLGSDDVWMVVSQEETPEYARIPSLGKREGILMAKAMSASRLIYWDGNQYRSAQTSD